MYYKYTIKLYNVNNMIFYNMFIKLTTLTFKMYYNM